MADVSLLDLLAPGDDDEHTVAVYFDDEEVTRAELRRLADALADRIRAAGVEAGQPVGVRLPNGPDLIAALFGVWIAGAVYVPLNPRLADDELAHVVETVRPAAIVTPDGVAPTGVADPPTYERDLAVISFTSGTTGRPKPVMLRHSAVLQIFDAIFRKLMGDRAAQVTERRAPMPNIIPTSLSLWAGLYNVLFAFRAGAPVIVMDRFDTKTFAAIVERFQIRSTVLPPAAMTMLADDTDINSLAPLRYVRSITAPLSPFQARRFRDRFGISVLNGYGQTELGGEIVGWNAEDSRRFGDSKLGSVGRPHDGVELRIEDRSGELLVRTPAMVAGYADGSELSDRLTPDGWFRTGDVGRVDDDGFLWIEGRVSDMINRGGLKVFPADVEEVLRLSDEVADCAVVGVPDDRLGEVPWAFVVPRAGGAAVDGGELEKLCREHLSPYKVPVRFVAIEALPRNEVGKVLTRELVKQAAP